MLISFTINMMTNFKNPLNNTCYHCNSHGDIYLSVKKKVRQLEVKTDSIDKRLRKVEAEMELLPVIQSFEGWTTLLERDRKILYALSKYEVIGTSTVQLAKDIKLEKPETSGRTIVLRRLYRIQKVSLQLKGSPLVVRSKVGKNWSLNFDDYVFELKESVPHGTMEESP